MELRTYELWVIIDGDALHTTRVFTSEAKAKTFRANDKDYTLRYMILHDYIEEFESQCGSIF